MILLNKLVRTDILILLAVLGILLVPGGFWKGALEGAAAAMLFISVLNHVDHYKKTKKLY
jgi:hypothetical protein